MNTPLSRLQHDISLAPGIPDSYRLFGEGPTVSTYGDLREVVGMAERQRTEPQTADLCPRCNRETPRVNATFADGSVHQCNHPFHAISAVPPSQREVQPREFGWAPGDYMIRCMDCGGDGSPGCDKRAIRCKACAQKRKDAAQPHPDVSGLVEALERARAQFHSYAEQHKAKGTADGDAKALTNAAYAEDMQRALAAFQSRQEEG